MAPDVPKRPFDAKEVELLPAMDYSERKKFGAISSVTRFIVKNIERQFPTLALDLRRANMDMDPGSFILRTLMISVMTTVMGWGSLYILTPIIGLPPAILFILLPLIFIGVFLWFMHSPRVKIAKKERDLDRDVLFAGRDMVISLKAGVPLFNAMGNVSQDYGVASKEFARVVERIQSGVPADVALQEVSEANTSKRFRQILFQIIASQRSGSDVAAGLDSTLDQISREQVISLKRYGQQLNPLTMFYLLVGIILPSIGITVGIVITSFVKITIDSSVLLGVILFILIIQIAFLAFMISSRPNLEV